ncbi:hypothetical protein GO308_09670 [Sphingomonas sp. SFZ2018-12]|uniref:hypothetical protein n=1 Tax=Sphingomonas sp. SFZ2018-12 TaxID=2683197 RepID=UPI001F0EC02C|nr:hypothetical protein [Sphingomonas sp. SFZ2018-12]MCH4893376.1 hypothetical protein [Sphingomonas sp. SFZ2018-12]
MTDLIVAVRLKADGSGLVGQLQASKAELDGLAGAEKRAATEAKGLSTATEGVAASAKSAERANEGLRQSQTRVTAGAGAQRAAAQQLGFQLQDVAVQYQAGTAAGVIFAQQGGQIIQALGLMSGGAAGATGRFAAFARFMSGPWGAAIGVAVTLAGVFGQKLFEVGEAAKAAELGSSGLAQAQSVLGDVFGKASSKIAAQNELLRINARLTAINLRADALKERQNFESVVGGRVQTSLSERALGALQYVVRRPFQGRDAAVRALDGSEAAVRNARSLQGLFDGVNNGSISRERAIRLAELKDFTGLNLTKEEVLNAIKDGVSADAKDEIAKLTDSSLDNGAVDPALRREGRAKKPKADRSAERAAKEAERLAGFGDRAADTIARLGDQFGGLSSELVRANEASRDLDNLIAELEKRKPPNYQQLVDQAKALKPLIQDSLVRPFRDALVEQERQIELATLAAQGRDAEAADRQLIYQIMREIGVESEDQLAIELAKRGVTADEVRQRFANLGVMRQTSREIDVQREKQQAYLGLIDDARAATEQLFATLRTDGTRAIGDYFNNLLSSFDQLFARQLTESLFGDFFRDLQDQVTGADKVSAAGDRIADEMDDAGAAVRNFATVVTKAADQIASGGAAADDGGDITVVGRKPGGVGNPFLAGFTEITDGLGKSLKSTFTSIFGDKGIFSDATQKAVGKAFGGAQVGATFGNALTDAFGIKGSSTGGAIGGAIGQAVGSSVGKALGSAAGPIGAIAGGLLGSVVGGLLKSSKRASATVTSVDGPATVTGNSGSRERAASGLATNIQDGLRQVAEQLGGGLGNFNVSIGVRNDDFRVDTTGSGRTKGPTKSESRNEQLGLFNFRDDAQAAVNFAIADAIKDGAITGLSAAVSKALQSSTDLNKAISEALKVQEVEILAGGPGAAIRQELAEFDRTAKERLRIARDYGLDVIAIERVNAEQRTKLVDDLLKQRVSGLKAFLDDTRFGSLAEGSLIDQRTTLQAEIARVRADAEAGVDGAADQLAELSRRLLEVSRDAFGTAGGEFAADRSNAISTAEAIIKAENDRIRAAQDATGATNAKLDTANALANEQNDLLAQINAGIAQLGTLGGGIAAAPGVGLQDYSRSFLTREALL